MRIAFGELAMSSNEFWDSTFREFYNRLYGARQVARVKERGEWERARFIAVYAAVGTRTKKPLLEKDFKFPWDKVGEALTYTPEMRKEIQERAAHIHGKTFENEQSE